MNDVREYRTIDKSAWPRGPWDNEPDKVQWRDEATGLHCLANRSPYGGHLCGYVGVFEGHPWFGIDEERLRVGDDYVGVHGGLTFSAFCQNTGDESVGVCHVPTPGEPRVWWLGFDCAHFNDSSPGNPILRKQGEYRDLAYVKSECAALAAQIVGGRCSIVEVEP